MSSRQIFKSNPKEAIYNHEQKISQFIEKQRKRLSEKNRELFLLSTLKRLGILNYPEPLETKAS